MAKRPSPLVLENESKKLKILEVPWKRGPSTWKGSDIAITQPFLKFKSMGQRDIRFNKYLGGKVDFDLLYNLLFQYLLPLLDLTQESLGGAKAGELNTRLSFVAMPIMIRVLSKKEPGCAPAILPAPQAKRIEAAWKRLEQELQSSAQGQASSLWQHKVKDLADRMSQILHVADSRLEEEDEETEGDPVYVPFKSSEDKEDERVMLDQELEGQRAGQASTSEVVTPKEQTSQFVDPEEGSPDSQYDPDFEHESHRGKWSVDLAMKVRDKRCPRIKLVKNLMDGKGSDTIYADSESPGGINQLAAYSCWHFLANVKEGRYSPIYSQLFNVSKYLAAEAVLTTVIKLNDKGQITPEALAEAQELQGEIWKQQRPKEAFDERTLVLMESLQAQLSEAERRLRMDVDVAKEDAKLPSGKYVVGEFYRNDKLHAFLDIPLEQEPAASSFAFLESQLRIGLGERVSKWTWDDVKLRLEEDLEKRRAKLADVTVDMDKDAWRNKWRRQGQAKSLEDLAYGRQRLL